MAKNILITGVAGFIGSNLLDLLLEQTDWEITGIDNLSTGSIENIKHNLSNNRFIFQQKRCSEITSVKNYNIVFHLAALPRIQPSFNLITEHIEANLLESIHLIELMIHEQHYPRFVYSGSSSIYGTPINYPTTENERIDCLSPYAFQKYEVEKYLELIGSRYPLDYVILRYFNPYGPRSFNPQNKFNAYSSVVGIFLDQKKRDQPLTVTGEGKQKRDFVHVSDVAMANLLAAKHNGKVNDHFNVGNGETIEIIELANIISENVVHIPKREGESEITWADITKIKNKFGWEPRFDIRSFVLENTR